MRKELSDAHSGMCVHGQHIFLCTEAQYCNDKYRCPVLLKAKFNQNRFSKVMQALADREITRLPCPLDKAQVLKREGRSEEVVDKERLGSRLDCREF